MSNGNVGNVDVANIEKLVTHKAIRLVNIATLNVDPSYQRGLKAKHKRIVAEFNEDALGVPLVAERDDGSLWIVDGQQRIAALKKLGKGRVRADVFKSQGPEHEAAIFKLVNLNRTKLTSQEEFRSLLTAGDKVAWSIKEAVEAMGFRLKLDTNKSGSSTTDLTCVTTLRSIAHSQNQGIPAIKFALEAVKKGWPGDKLGTHNLMVQGLAVFYSRNGGIVDMERLVSRMNFCPASKIAYEATQTSLSPNRGFAVADALERLYKKKMRRNKG